MRVPGQTRQTIARRCLVSGRVQGVNYRATAAQRARLHGIGGYARNLEDGRVEVLACGEAPAVEAFIEWLWLGPAAAKVTDVLIEVLVLEPPQHPRGFAIA